MWCKSYPLCSCFPGLAGLSSFPDSPGPCRVCRAAFSYICPGVTPSACFWFQKPPQLEQLGSWTSLQNWPFCLTLRIWNISSWLGKRLWYGNWQFCYNEIFTIDRLRRIFDFHISTEWNFVSIQTRCDAGLFENCSQIPFAHVHEIVPGQTENRVRYPELEQVRSFDCANKDRRCTHKRQQSDPNF